MRTSALILLVSASFIAPTAATAQQEPASADDYVCTFSGDCGDDAATPDQPATGGRPQLEATRGFALSGPEENSSSNAARPNRPVGATQTGSRRATPAPRQRRAQNLAGASSQRVPGQRVNLRLSFVTGSATLTREAQEQAEAFASALLRPQLRNMRFMIEGHTDSVGSRASNLALSQRRAETLADFLIRAGVDPDRLVVRGYGPDRPIIGMPRSAGENRRVEAVRIS